MFLYRRLVADEEEAMTNQLTTHQLMWLCAMYEKRCQQPSTSNITNPTGQMHSDYCECKGTGRVPLLEGVREGFFIDLELKLRPLAVNAAAVQDWVERNVK